MCTERVRCAMHGEGPTAVAHLRFSEISFGNLLCTVSHLGSGYLTEENSLPYRTLDCSKQGSLPSRTTYMVGIRSAYKYFVGWLICHTQVYPLYNATLQYLCYADIWPSSSVGLFLPRRDEFVMQRVSDGFFTARPLRENRPIIKVDVRFFPLVHEAGGQEVS